MCSIGEVSCFLLNYQKTKNVHCNWLTEQMECREVAEAAEDTDGMLTFELEAAAALAGLACSSSVTGDFERIVPQEGVVSSEPYQALGGQQISGKTFTMVAGHTNTLETVDISATRTCNISNQSKVSGTSRHNFTQAEKEAQRLRRVLANRESARETIRRRKATYLELTEKAANMSLENTDLRHKRELALKKYNYLKDKNEFLKSQLAKRKHAEPVRLHDKPRSSPAVGSSSAASTTPICLQNQPSFLPFFWPFNSQCTSNPDFLSSSRFHMPMWDGSCLNQGQECSTDITRSGPPFFVLPVPCLLPIVSPNGKLESLPGIRDRQHEPPPCHQCAMCSSVSTLGYKDNQNSQTETCNSSRPVSTSNAHGAGFHLPPESAKPKNHRGQFISTSREQGNDAITSAEARRQRRELMKLKYTRGRTHDADIS